MIYVLCVGMMVIVLFAAMVISAVAGVRYGVVWWIVTLVSYVCLDRLIRKIKRDS